MLQDRYGFTLIEILIVILIISITTAIVAPVAYKLVGSFDKKINQQKLINQEKTVKYLAFITDEPCKMEKGVIICGKDKFKSLKDALK